MNIPKLKIGTDDFKELLDQGGYFVDKTRLIRSVLDAGKCLLLPRPRRFGKTLNLSMLRYFFENCGESRKALFDGLTVSDDTDAMTHQGRYPVIHLSLKDVKGGDWTVALATMVGKIASLYKQHGYLADGLPEDERLQFERLSGRKADRADLNVSLAILISHLHAYHGQPVVVLLDEYDTPIIEAWGRGYYDEMVDFMRCWLGAGLKHENGPALFRAVITGILRVAKESIFSGLNHLETWTTLTPGPFADKFGFTQSEVDLLLTDFQLPGMSEPLREWYNGYDFGGVTIYNPWSVVSCVNRYPAPVGPQWLNTASNHLVYKELEDGGMEIRRDLEKLMAGRELRYPIDESITFGDVGRSPRNIWSLLYFCGYLRADDCRRDPLDKTLMEWRLSIPNLEVSVAYRQFIERIYTERIPDGVQPLLNCFINDRPAEDFERALQDLVVSLVSSHDAARRPEAVYHAFVLGLLAGLRGVYDIRSNAESGYGRGDIVMCPKTARYPLGYVIEFKAVGEGADIERVFAGAFAQIAEQDYASALRSAGVCDEQIRRLAMVFAGKRLHVRRG